MSRDAARILDFWHAVELFSPQNLPRLRDSRRDEPIAEWSPERPLPWDEGQPLRQRAPGSKTAWRHHVYLGVFDLEQAVVELEERFGRPPGAWRDRVPGEACLAAFAVGDDGRPLVDTYTLSSLGWALGRLGRVGGSLSRIDGFEGAQEAAREAFAERMALLPDDEEGSRLAGLGFRLGPPIDGGIVASELHRASATCGWPADGRGLRHAAILRSAPTARSRKWSADDFDFLNSFFLADLRRVGRAVVEGDLGAALQTYLALPDAAEVAARRDVRSEPAVLAAGLEPRRFPPGRWPSRGGWPLVLSQQLAVNEAVATLAEEGGLVAVNGPPGTGKTTLLRDLVAAVVVRRADALAGLKRSGDAFSGRAGWWQAASYRVSVQALRPELTGHEIVVASTNNGAVENVTLEIPSQDAVDEEALVARSYFPETGSAVLGRPAWALLAARLGNKQNRSKFATNFWFGAQPSDEEEEPALDLPMRAMLDRLREAEKQPPPSWADAVAGYHQARGVVERVAGERQALADTIGRLPVLDRDVARAGAVVEEASAGHAAAAEEHRRRNAEGERRRERARTLEERLLAHRKARPGAIEIVLSRGRAWREWRSEDREVRERLRAARRALDEAEERSVRADDDRRRAALRVEEALLAREEAERRRQSVAGEVEAFRERHPEVTIPTPEHLAAVERELSAPWIDEEWNQARSRLFLAALELHRSLILCQAATFRRNLQGAVDLLTGKVPSGAPLAALEAAWATLFLVVPVVSTTFASFDRLFACLGREKLGWLLVDEAGQAVPQAAVGAIWRSRRVVVVGDPMQLEPIVTLPVRAIEALRRHGSVAADWRPDTWSVQHLADRRSRLGTSLPSEGDELWVGAPLRVHRRCDEPMFSLANQIAYDGMMVHGTGDRLPPDWPESGWYDVAATSSEGNWIPEEGAVALEILDVLGDGADVVVLSPFRHVVRGMRQLLRPHRSNLHVGTVHTFQGKEADGVLLVLGGSLDRDGALDWAASRPNLLNVAVTRARRRLYVVGSRSRWRRRPFFSELARCLEVRPASALAPPRRALRPPAHLDS